MFPPGRVALVTGAAQGIGRAIALALATQGVKVAAADVQAERLEQACAGHTNLHAYAVDVADAQAVATLVGQLESSLGPIDYLVNAAGVLHLGEALDLTDADWLRTFAINTHGVFFLSRAVARGMRERRRGAIVTLGSNAASTARTQMSAYGASKAATAQLMRCLGLELAPFGIRCNVVAPGSTDTDMQRQLWTDETGPQRVIGGSLPQFRCGIPLGRIAAPEDIAGAVLFLLSDAARHITLQSLIVDGGATLGAG